MKSFIKKTLTIASAIVLVLSMSNIVSAADDVVLNDAGSPFIKTFDPGPKGKEYQYLGYAYCFEVGPEYKYLKITYTGDKTAFDELRLEFVVNSDPSLENKLPPCWFRQNAEGTIKTVDGKEVPNPSSKEQTAIIDLEKSGIDLKTGIRAFHIHDTPGKGTFKIIDARLMTSADGSSSDSGDKSAKGNSSNNNASNSSNLSTDKKSDSSAVKVTENASLVSTSTTGSNNAQGAGSFIYPIAIAGGGIIVAGLAFVVSRKMKWKE